MVKKFFEQHDDPAATSEISDYLQEVRRCRSKGSSRTSSQSYGIGRRRLECF